MNRTGQGTAGRRSRDDETKDEGTKERAAKAKTTRSGRSKREDSEPKPAPERAARVPGPDDPDVYLDIPVVKVDEIELEVENLAASVSLQAEVLDLLKLKVGVDVELGRVELTIKGVEAQALLKVQLDNVRDIITRVLETIDTNPEILERVAKGVETSLSEVSRGAGEAAGYVGRGAGEAAGHVGRGAGEAAGHVGRGAGEAAGQAGRGAASAAEKTAEAVGGAAETLGDEDEQ